MLACYQWPRVKHDMRFLPPSVYPNLVEDSTMHNQSGMNHSVEIKMLKSPFRNWFPLSFSFVQNSIMPLAAAKLPESYLSSVSGGYAACIQHHSGRSRRRATTFRAMTKGKNTRISPRTCRNFLTGRDTGTAQQGLDKVASPSPRVHKLPGLTAPHRRHEAQRSQRHNTIQYHTFANEMHLRSVQNPR